MLCQKLKIIFPGCFASKSAMREDLALFLVKTEHFLSQKYLILLASLKQSKKFIFLKNFDFPDFPKFDAILIIFPGQKIQWEKGFRVPPFTSYDKGLTLN